MPLKLTVGQTRKISENYNSRGFSLHVEAELPANAIDDVNALANSANHIFQLVDDLIEEQIRKANNPEAGGPKVNGGHHVAPRIALPSTVKPMNGHARPGSSSQGAGSIARTNGNGTKTRPMTSAQNKAIQNMTARLDIDVEQLVRDEFGAGLAKLTISQASEIIDQLKAKFSSNESAGARS